MIIDVNTAVGRWPFSEAQSVTPQRLSSLLARAGVDLALTSSLEAVLHEDPDGDNRRLYRQLRGHRRLLPVPVLNPLLADWQASVAMWAEKTLAFKILPSYHAYSLAHENVAALAAELAKRRRPLLVQMRMEDERVHAPAMKVPAVPVADVVALAERFPDLSIVALGTYTAEAAQLLIGARTANAIGLVGRASSPAGGRGRPPHCLFSSARANSQPRRVWADVSFLDGLDVVGGLVREHSASAERLLLGSHSPLYYTQSAVLKVQTAEAEDAVRQAILGGNARELFGLSKALRK